MVFCGRASRPWYKRLWRKIVRAEHRELVEITKHKVRMDRIRRMLARDRMSMAELVRLYR
jgi:hypothetical protein